MANETRRDLYKFAKKFIVIKYSNNLLPKNFTSCITKCANLATKRQVFINSLQSNYNKYFGDNIKERFSVFLRSKNCHSIAAQRVRRTIQISDLYRSLGYDLSSFRYIYQNVLNCFLSRIKLSPSLLLGAVVFNWNEGHISEEELEKTAEDIQFLKRSSKEDGDWQKLVVKQEVQVLRQPISNSHLYQYKILGSYKDVDARSFYNIQIDLPYRKKWDENVISLEKVDEDESSGTEVVHWITHFPYPLTSREYIYVRRYKVDEKSKSMVIVNRAVSEHPSIQEQQEGSTHVRVTDYCSKMVIKPHTTFDENGFDFVLTYFDDPKSGFPKIAESWAASSGIPNFVEKLHNAAIMLKREKLNAKDDLYAKTNNLIVNSTSNFKLDIETKEDLNNKAILDKENITLNNKTSANLDNSNNKMYNENTTQRTNLSNKITSNNETNNFINENQKNNTKNINTYNNKTSINDNTHKQSNKGKGQNTDRQPFSDHYQLHL